MHAASSPSTPAPYESRASQIARLMRVLIEEGRWEGTLPRERELATEMGVGRMTLRDALSFLEQDGTIKREKPRGSWLVNRRKVNGRKRARSIGLILPRSLDSIETNNILMVDELRRIVYGRGYALSLYESRSSALGIFYRFVRNVMAKNHHDCWILLTSTAEIQEWLARQDIPVVLAATRYPGIILPSVDIDHRALCRHAVGQMVLKGHTRLALLLPKNARAGDIESRLGFQEGVASTRQVLPEPRILSYEESKSGICRLAESLLTSHPRPTAWLVCRTDTYLTVHSYLQARGVSVPDQVSIICRDSESYLRCLVPEPTCYVYDTYRLARLTADFAFKIGDGKNLRKQHRLTMPTFVEGATLGPPPRDHS